MIRGGSFRDSQRGVDPGDQPLGGGLLVAGGAVDLAGEEQARKLLGLQGRLELLRWGIVVLDGIAVPHDLGVLEPGDQRDDRFLNVAGQAGGDAVAVVFQGVAAFGLEEDLVGLAIGEPDHLVLDGRAVPGPGGLDLSAVHRGPVQVGPDDVVDGRIGRGDVAIELVLNDPVGQERERDRSASPG